MLNIAICDDSKEICINLKQKIYLYFKDIYINLKIDIFTSSYDFLSFKELNKIDILFLDIEIDKLSGIDIASTIRNIFSNYNMKIIFISAYKDYVMELFKVRPVDFLTKPINDIDLEKTLNNILNILNREKYIFKYKIKNNIYFKDIKDILFFESFGRKIKIISKMGEDIFYGNLRDIVKELEKYNFIQTHNSFLVNYSYIIKVNSNEIYLSNNVIIPISRNNKDKVLKMYMR